MRAAWLLVAIAGCGRLGFEPRSDGAASDGAGPDAPDVGFFIGPAGDDANPGTRHAPWKTFTASVRKLAPGDRLNVLDGEYDARQVGAIELDCSSGQVAYGTAAAPIVVRADHPRRAHIFGVTQPIGIFHCAYWEFDDLFVEGLDDINDKTGSVVQLDNSDHLTVRGLLIVHPNRYANNYAIDFGHTTFGTAEDLEIYDYFRGAATDFDSTGSTWTRIYGNGRQTQDISGGYTSTCPGGDFGLLSYYSRGATLRDAIFEDSCEAGVSIETGANVSGDTGVGDNHVIDSVIVLGPGVSGMETFTECSTNACSSADRIAQNNRFTNVVAAGFTDGFVLDGESNAIDHGTALSATNRGVVLDVSQQAGGVFAPSATVDSTLVGGAMIGVAEANQTTWMVTSSNVVGATTAYSPLDNHVVGSTTIDPMLGACVAYLPAGSPMIGAGTGGTNIGADIRTLASTGAAAWLPQWAGCGAVVAGVNDDPTTSCIGVHQRLAIGGACPVQ